MITKKIHLDIPENVYVKLVTQARNQNRTIKNMAETIILQTLIKSKK